MRQFIFIVLFAVLAFASAKLVAAPNARLAPIPQIQQNKNDFVTPTPVNKTPVRLPQVLPPVQRPQAPAVVPQQQSAQVIRPNVVRIPGVVTTFGLIT